MLQYARETQRTQLPHVQGVHWERREDSILLDVASRRNLELDSRIIGRREHTLVNIMDECATPMGGRLLRRWLHRPLRDIHVLQARHHAIGILLEWQCVDVLYQQLRAVGDIERILARVALKSARPRDLSQLCSALGTLPNLQQQLKQFNNPHLQNLAQKIGAFPQLHALLSTAIVEKPPQLLRDGGVIAPGYDQALDELRGLSQNADEYLKNLENTERESTGITNLKVGFNKVHGYYIEVSRIHADKVPPHYIRRQTLKAVERYITEELKGFEDKVLSANERALNREKYLYDLLLDKLLESLYDLQASSAALAELDVLNNFAERADTLKFYPPEFTDKGCIQIIEGRHPVVEAVQDEPFIPNDLQLDGQQRMLILTSANMAGKCISVNDLVLTSKGIVPLKHLMPSAAEIDRFEALEAVTQVKSLYGFTQASHFYYGGQQKTVKIQTQHGFTLEGTPEHRILVRCSDGSEGWRRLDELTGDEACAIDHQLELWGDCLKIDTMLALPHIKKHYTLPTSMTRDLAYLLGLLVNDGNFSLKNCLSLTIVDSFISEEFRRIMQDVFGYTVKVRMMQTEHPIYSSQICAFLTHLGLGTDHIPKSILQAPRHIVIAFLQGLYDIGGYINHGKIRLSTFSHHLAQEVQMCLLNLGILSAIITKNPTYVICISNAFRAKVGITNKYFYDKISSIEAGEAEVADLSVPEGHAFVANGFVNHNSTYMRQTALIVLLAHIGSFVPAQQAIIGPIDGIFTRIGASDDLTGGRSTFMVEMTETANILHNATHNSLVLMDEIGRGTSTFDGLSLAWACAEYLADKVGAYTLFATHYFELTRLPEMFHSIANAHLDAVEQGDKLIFMHTVKEGPANKSYGLQVALLAGVPKNVVDQARIRLKQLEAQQATSQQIELTLPPPSAPHPIISKIKELSPEDMTPKQALEMIYQLKALLDE